MSRRRLPILVILALIAVVPAGAVTSTRNRRPAPQLDSGASFARPDARELLRQAKDLWHVQKDYTGALAKFNAAVAADPGDYDVLLQRAHFFETLASMVVERDRAKFQARAQADYEAITNADPDSMIAGIARDGLTRLAGESLLDGETVMCPTAAVEIHARGDALYGAQRYAEAATEYEKATEGCPAAAVWWVDYADSYYMLEDYENAKALLLKALSVDPWNREAHRFLADAEVHLGNREAAVQQLMLAVVSDPIYEAGWSALKSYAGALGRSSTRVYGDKKAGPSSADGAAWAAYRAAKASGRSRRDLGSALAVERTAVAAALKSPTVGPFWSMMARAQRAGLLDEAIFMHLLDAALADEYPAFREKNAERLTAHLETVILR